MGFFFFFFRTHLSETISFAVAANDREDSLPPRRLDVFPRNARNQGPFITPLMIDAFAYSHRRARFLSAFFRSRRDFPIRNEHYVRASETCVVAHLPLPSRRRPVTFEGRDAEEEEKRKKIGPRSHNLIHLVATCRRHVQTGPGLSAFYVSHPARFRSARASGSEPTR